jgi:hypothetical protein
MVGAGPIIRALVHRRRFQGCCPLLAVVECLQIFVEIYKNQDEQELPSHRICDKHSAIIGAFNAVILDGVSLDGLSPGPGGEDNGLHDCSSPCRCPSGVIEVPRPGSL